MKTQTIKVATIVAALLLATEPGLAAKAKASKKDAPAPAAPTAPAVPAAAPAADDPDVPRFLRGAIDKEEFLRARSEDVAARRGFEDLFKHGYNARSKAIADMQKQHRIGVQANPVTWTEIGPFPVPNGQTQTTSTSVTGRVTSIAIDPTNNSIVYLGTAFGGVWRSTNGGTTWTPIFDTAQTLAIGALALAPSDHTILYVGTGEPNGSIDSYAGVGLYRINNADTSPILNGPINPIRSYIAGDGSTAINNPVFTGRSISSILVHPADPATVFVGTAGGVIGAGADAPGGGTIPPLGMRGLYRSTNATAAPASVTFQKLAVITAPASPTCATPFDTPCTGNRNVDTMVFPDPGDLNQLVVWMNGTTTAGDGGIYRSVNALAATPTFTQTFTTTVSSARAMFANYNQGAVPLHVIYVATGESRTGTSCATAGNSGALRVSTDSGATWSAKLTGGGGFCGGQCFYNFGFDTRPGATAAIADDLLWLGGNTQGGGTCNRLHARSTDGGATFADSAVGLHADTHFIKVDPTNANIVYHGNDGGVFKSTDAGATWTSLNNNPLSASQYVGMATHPTSVNYTIGGTQDNGTHMYTTGATWNRIDFGDGGYARIDQTATDATTVTLYHTYFNQTNTLVGFARVNTTACATDGQWAFKGIYGGAVDTTVWCDGSTDTFNGITITDAVNFYAPIEIGPGTPNTIYYGSDRLYRSTNKGDTVVVVSQSPIVSGSPIRTIGISKANDNFRMVGLNNGRVWGTTTGSSTLTEFTAAPSTGFPTPLKQVLRVAFDPNDATGGTAYVALGGFWGNATGHVWKLTGVNTGTATWTAASGTGLTAIPDVPVNCLLIDPLNSNHIYAGTDIGVYYSSDGGSTWNPLGSNLPVVAVFEMAFNADPSPASRVLRIATHGRGMWELIPPTPVSLQEFHAE